MGRAGTRWEGCAKGSHVPWEGRRGREWEAMAHDALLPGMMLGGGCGQELAHWIVHGRPERDMYSYDIR